MCTTLDHLKKENIVRRCLQSESESDSEYNDTRVVLNKAAPLPLRATTKERVLRETRETQSHRAAEKNYFRHSFFLFFFYLIRRSRTRVHKKSVTPSRGHDLCAISLKHFTTPPLNDGKCHHRMLPRITITVEARRTRSSRPCYTPQKRFCPKF